MHRIGLEREAGVSLPFPVEQRSHEAMYVDHQPAGIGVAGEVFRIDALGLPEPGGVIRVELEATHDGFASISVSDNGKGFPREDRNKLTEPYVTTRAEGTGLGLPIVIKIFEDHHGSVELLDGLPRAEGGVGARVVMKFPLRVEAGASPATPASAVQAAS